jgi:hypothetical protein
MDVSRGAHARPFDTHSLVAGCSNGRDNYHSSAKTSTPGRRLIFSSLSSIPYLMTTGDTEPTLGFDHGCVGGSFLPENLSHAGRSTGARATRCASSELISCVTSETSDGFA